MMMKYLQVLAYTASEEIESFLSTSLRCGIEK